MKIAFVYDVAYPYVRGGIEKRDYVFAKHLVEDGHDVHMFTMNYWLPDEIMVAKGITYHGVCPAMDIYGKNGKRKLIEPLKFSIALMGKLFKEDFDVIECSAFPYFPVFVCALYGLIKRKKVFITWHEYWGKYWDEYLGGALGLAGKIIERLAVIASPNIITISQKTKRDLLKAGVPERKIVVIENGVSLEKIKAAPVSKETSDVIFIGRLMHHKNAELLVKAMKTVKERIPNVKCILVGTGPEEEKLLKLIKHSHLQNNVEIKSNIPTDDLFGLLKASKVFVFPSEREGFGITVLEAKAAGLPVITLNHENNAAVDLVNNEVDGYLCRKDVDDFSDKILLLLENEPKRKLAGKESEKNASVYSWCVFSKKIELIFQGRGSA
jgi:glycosyltransferase involved in cell wall biosynthesis